MTDREKFQAWAKAKRCDLEKFTRGEKAGQYKNPVVEKMCEAYLAALASQQPADDGWIEWVGGECPLAETNCLEVKFRSGEVDSIPAVTADMYEWMHGGCFSDIIAYRVVKP